MNLRISTLLFLLTSFVAAADEPAQNRPTDSAATDAQSISDARVRTAKDAHRSRTLTEEKTPRPANAITRRPCASGPVFTLRAAGVSPQQSKASSGVVRAFTNTLGMEFVPVKAVPDVIFCRWETRVTDFAAFCKDTDRSYEKPDFAQGDHHPVVNVSFNDAREFCAWLSKKEGKLYRLPTDHEWSGAVGIATGEDPAAFPKSKGIEAPKNKRNEIKGVFPWSNAWPPPPGSGNVAASLHVDRYDYTSPVGSFEPTADGLYDLAGNVCEWCDDIYEPKEHYRVLRGGSWRCRDSMFLLSAFRGRGNTPTRHDTRGFRVVLEVGDDEQVLLIPVRERAQHEPVVPHKVPVGFGSRLVTNLTAGESQTVVTYGTSLTSGGAWVGQLDAALKAKWPGAITVVNSGAGGMWSKWGVENLDNRVIAKQPDTLFVEFGINDAYLPYKTSVKEARDNLNNMIDRVLAAKADTEIILMTMNPPVGNHLNARPAIKEYYEMYRQVAKARKLKLIDHYLNWEPIREKERDLFDNYVPDGIHPGATGCERVITPALLTALGVSSSATPDKIKVLLVGGRGSHDWHGFHDTIAPVLEKAGDFELKLTPNVDDLHAKYLANYRVILFYGPGGNFRDRAQERDLRHFVTNGGGLVGVHATDAFKQSDVYWRLLGGRFTTHRGGEFYLRIEDKQHPVTAPLEDFKIHDETYANEYHPDFKLHSLGRIARGQEQQSMVWVQNYGKGRVFNTTLGHDHKAWRNQHFQRLVLRGLYWAAGREPK